MKINTLSKCLCAAILICIAGCSSSAEKAAQDFLELNKTNVAKVRTCFILYAYRNQMEAPKNQEELLEFLESGKVDRNLKRAGINPEAIDQIFVSERDGQPLKIRWGSKLSQSGDSPIAFETTGVGGVRLVAADKIIEAATDEQYDRLWSGKYSSMPNAREIDKLEEEMAGDEEAAIAK